MPNYTSASSQTPSISIPGVEEESACEESVVLLSLDIGSSSMGVLDGISVL